MARRRFTEAQIEHALRKSGGIQAAAAQALEQATGIPITRQAVHKRVQQSSRLQQAIEEAQEETLDLAESVVIKTLNNADNNPHAALNAARFYLETRGRYRGYVRKDYLLHVADPNQMTDDELRLAVDELRRMQIDMEPVAQRPALPAPRRIRRPRWTRG